MIVFAATGVCVAGSCTRLILLELKYTPLLHQPDPPEVEEHVGPT
jgi:hypothetical protein